MALFVDAHIQAERARKAQLVLGMLREPGYTKVIGCLSQDTDCYCIEGLICEAFRRDTGQGRWYKPFDDSRERVFSLGNKPNSIAAQQEVMDWLDQPQLIEWQGRQYSFAGLNDRTSLTFPEIADILEKQWILS